MQRLKMYCSYWKGVPFEVIQIHETAADCSPWTPWSALYKAEEITLGLRVHQDLQLYSSALFAELFFTGSLGLANAPNCMNSIWTFSQRAVCKMDFIRDFATAVGTSN